MAELFNITHDGGNLGEYDSTVIGGGDLSAEVAAALASTVEGLNVLIDDNGAIYGQKDEASPNTSETIRFRFYLDPNSINMGSGNSFVLVKAFSSASRNIAQVNLQYDGANYEIRSFFGQDLGSTVILHTTDITDEEHYIEVLVVRAANSGSDDGSMEVWIDGGSVASKADIDNFDQFDNYDFFRAGAVLGIDTGTRGTIFIDEIVMRDDSTEIGEAALAPSVSDSASVADTPTLTVSAPQVSVSDSASIAESVNVNLAHSISIFDNVSVADTPTIDPLIINASTSEAIGVADTPTIDPLILPGVAVSDNVSVVDTPIVAPLDLPGIVTSENISVTESFIVRLFGDISVSESITVTTPLFTMDLLDTVPASRTITNFVRVLVGDVAGWLIAEIRAQVGPVSWRLNQIGRVQFTISTNDAKAIKDFLDFGNRIILLFDNGLPNWGGIIDTPTSWNDSDSVVITAYSGEYLLSTRLTAKERVFDGNSAGSMFRVLVEDANSLEDMGITMGEVWVGGGAFSQEYHYDNVLKKVVGDLIQRLSTGDFDIEPKIVNGRIVFVANFYEQRGRTLQNIALVEGRNLSLVNYSQHGPIVNRWHILGAGADWDTKPTAYAEDATSIADYGLRVDADNESDGEQAQMLEEIAKRRVSETKDPSDVLTVEAVNLTPALFSEYHVGDSISLLSYSTGWDGYFHLVRVLAREYDPGTGLVRQVVQRSDW